MPKFHAKDVVIEHRGNTERNSIASFFQLVKFVIILVSIFFTTVPVKEENKSNEDSSEYFYFEDIGNV